MTDFRKNKRGDIPTTLLVIGVIAICGLAIFVFINSLGQTKDSFHYIGEIEKAKMKIEKESLNKYHDEINKSNIRLDFNDWKEEKMVFSIDYSSP
ncbi:MAG TPA: hypothetical protein VJ912_02055 [Candidatus Nanoarchaeia archaeon]|nr:hypothetical protein [Candidatus Nanoarchaeia archaeon]